MPEGGGLRTGAASAGDGADGGASSIVCSGFATGQQTSPETGPFAHQHLVSVRGEGYIIAMAEYRRPVDLANRMARRMAAQSTRSRAFRRETFALPREAARAKAREMFARFPKAAYMTEIESWRELPDDRIEFTMRRLPTAD